MILLARNANQEELFEEEEIVKFKQLLVPPQFVALKGGGLVTLYYDNFLAVGPAAKKVCQRIQDEWRLKECFNIAIKELECLSPEMMQREGCDFLGTHLRTRVEQGACTLTIAQATDRLDNWKKAASTEKIEAWRGEGELQMSSRQIASAIGRILWRVTLAFLPLAECFDVVDILRRLPRSNWDELFALTRRRSKVPPGEMALGGAECTSRLR